MSDKTYTLYNGHEVEWAIYNDALRKAWAIYGALVASGHVMAYNYDGSERQQLEKYHRILTCVEDIATTLAAFHGDTFQGDFETWDRVNRTSEPDEDFEHVPTGGDEVTNWIKDALRANKLPYKLVHDDPETEALRADLQ